MGAKSTKLISRSAAIEAITTLMNDVDSVPDECLAEGLEVLLGSRASFVNFMIVASSRGEDDDTLDALVKM